VFLWFNSTWGMADGYITSTCKGLHIKVLQIPFVFGRGFETPAQRLLQYPSRSAPSAQSASQQLRYITVRLPVHNATGFGRSRQQVSLCVSLVQLDLGHYLADGNITLTRKGLDTSVVHSFLVRGSKHRCSALLQYP